MVIAGFDAAVGVEDLVSDFDCFACVFWGSYDSHGAEFNSFNGLININLTPRIILDPINHPPILANQELHHALRYKNNRLYRILLIVLLILLILKPNQLLQQIRGALPLLLKIRIRDRQYLPIKVRYLDFFSYLYLI